MAQAHFRFTHQPLTDHATALRVEVRDFLMAVGADIGEKVRDKLLDSLVKSVAAPAVKAQAAIESEAKAAPQAVSGDAPAKAAAQPVGDEKSFAAETGTLGIPRAD